METTENHQSMPRVARALDRVTFFSLLVLIPLIAVPYGSVEPWWVAIFECVVLLIAILGVVEAFILKRPLLNDIGLATPILVLVLFAVLQSLPLFSGVGLAPARVSLSADPYGTRMFAVELFALVLVGLLLRTHTSTRSRLRALIYVVVGVAVASALFGILRHELQQGPGFVLPALPNNGKSFAQFINRNHFGFLVEMALGLTLGMLIGERTFRRILVFLSLAGMLWVALVFSNSRGGILASLCQLLFMVVLIDPLRKMAKPHTGAIWRRIQGLAGGFALRGLLILVCIGLFAYGVTWVGGETVVTNFELAGTTFSEQDISKRDNTSRQQIWTSTWELIKSHPVAGAGFGGYWIAIAKYHNASGAFTPQQAHNDYLELLASGGLVGGGLVMWFVVVFLRRAHKNLGSKDQYRRAAAIGALTGIFGVLIHSFVDFGLHIPANALVFCVLIVIVAHSPDEAVSGSEADA